MADITVDQAKRLNELKIEWLKIKMNKLKAKMPPEFLQVENAFVEFYENLFGEKLIPQYTTLTDDGSGLIMRFEKPDLLTDEGMMDLEDLLNKEANFNCSFRAESDTSFSVTINNIQSE